MEYFMVSGQIQLNLKEGNDRMAEVVHVKVNTDMVEKQRGLFD
jgi:hypothetical protein